MIRQFVCARLNGSTRRHTRERVRTECEAVICERGLIVEGSVCIGGRAGLSRGRPRLRAAASLSFLFDDVPHHKALNTPMRRLWRGVETGVF